MAPGKRKNTQFVQNESLKLIRSSRMRRPPNKLSPGSLKRKVTNNLIRSRACKRPNFVDLASLLNRPSPENTEHPATSQLVATSEHQPITAIESQPPIDEPVEPQPRTDELVEPIGTVVYHDSSAFPSCSSLKTFLGPTPRVVKKRTQAKVISIHSAPVEVPRNSLLPSNTPPIGSTNQPLVHVPNVRRPTTPAMQHPPAPTIPVRHPPAPTVSVQDHPSAPAISVHRSLPSRMTVYRQLITQPQYSDQRAPILSHPPSSPPIQGTISTSALSCPPSPPPIRATSTHPQSPVLHAATSFGPPSESAPVESGCALNGGAKWIRFKADPDLPQIGEENLKKNKRGLVSGARARDMKRTLGHNIKVEPGESGIIPKRADVRSALVHEIGSCVREKIPMIAPSYGELPPETWRIVYDHLSVNFEIDASVNWLWNFICKSAAERFRDWKSSCRTHFLKHGEAVPVEFIYRKDQWKWLVDHFRDPAYMAKCNRMKKARNSKNRFTHHSGKLPFYHRAQKHMADNHPAPYVAAYAEAYERCAVGSLIAAEMNERVQEVLDDRVLNDPGAVEDPLPVETQTEIMTEVIGKRKGAHVVGTGSCLKRPPRPRSVTAQSAEAIQLKDEILKLQVENEKAVRREEDQRAKNAELEERLRAVEELMRVGMGHGAPSDGASFPYPSPGNA